MKVNFSWRLTAFSVIFFSLFVYLGLWQLSRASEKEALIARDELRLQQPPVDLSELIANNADPAQRSVRLSGAFDPTRLMLLDNRVLNGEVGFEVLVPFRLDTGLLVIVDRGFVVMAKTRDVMPLIPKLIDSPTATGKIYINNDSYEQKAKLAGPDKPPIVQTANPKLLEPIFTEKLYPNLIRLDLDDINALPRYWPSTVMPPAKHFAYAVQWFAMAIAIVIAYLYFTLRREHD